MSDVSDSYFTTAINDFWGGQNATDTDGAIAAVIIGLQNFCAGVRAAGNPNDTADQYLKLAIDHFWSAQFKIGTDRDVSMSTGCQLFCAGVKEMYK